MEQNYSNNVDERYYESLPENNNNKEIKIYEIINSIIDSKSKKEELIKKLNPFFALKVIPSQKKIDKVYPTIAKIDPEKVDLIKEFRYQEELYDSESIFETKSKSLGLSKADLDLSLRILGGRKKSFNYDFKYEKGNDNSQKSSKIHCIHSIVVVLFRIVIPMNEIKFASQINEILKEIENSKETDKKLLLENLVETFGLYVPLELLVGGRINYSFDANNDEEIDKINSVLENDIKFKFGGMLSFFSSGAGYGVGGTLSKTDNNFAKNLDKIENLNISMEGGDYKDTNDFKKWVLSINIDNLQIIEYKTLIPIYRFIQGLEQKIRICFQKYDEIVLEEIKNLIKNDFMKKEQEISCGTSLNTNSWEIGITEQIYKSFIIYNKKVYKKLTVSKYGKNSLNRVIINGMIPDGFIIVGYIIKTNANSKANDIICKWERKKELSIIGSNCYKFIFEIEKAIGDYNEIDCTCEIFCIHKSFLIAYDTNSFNDYKNDEHYFLNCDCCQTYDCYYNKFYLNNKNWRQLDLEEYKRLVNEAEIQRNEREAKLKEKAPDEGISIRKWIGLIRS